mgnify:CR=1 FL=1
MGKAHPTLGGDYESDDDQVKAWVVNVNEGTSSTQTEAWLKDSSNGFGFTDQQIDAIWWQDVLEESLVVPVKKLEKRSHYNVESPISPKSIRAWLDDIGETSSCIYASLDANDETEMDDDDNLPNDQCSV